MLAFPPLSATLLPCTVLLPGALPYPPPLLLPCGCLLLRTARLLLWPGLLGLRLLLRRSLLWPGLLRALGLLPRSLRLCLLLHLRLLAPLLSGLGGALALLLFSCLRPSRLSLGALLFSGGRRKLLL
jgi:hypothetical protein